MREEDIRKRDVLNRYLELVEADAREIFGDKSSFRNVSCPACAGFQNEEQFIKADFRYVECAECGTLFLNPRPSYEKLMEIYKESPSTKYWVEEFFTPMIEPRREMIFKPRAEYIAGQFPELEKANIADIGAGFGLFLEELRKIWPDAQYTAIEPSVDMAQICRRLNFTVIEAMLEDIDRGQSQFDLLTAFELFEHLHEPAHFIRNVRGILKEGGYLYLTTLNGRGFDVQVQWDSSKSVSPPHHINFLNPSSIRTLLENEGFEVVAVETPGELDWDIVEGRFIHEGSDPGRFFRTVSRYASPEAKKDLQAWIKKHQMSSHMRVVARKGGYDSK